MVQADSKLKRPELGTKESRTSKVKYTDGRKARPVKEKVPEHTKKVSSAIGRNIEHLMAARVAHEGGHLRVIKAPENVTEYVKSGPKMSKLQIKLRSNQNAYRKSKADKHQEMMQSQILKEVRAKEAEEEHRKLKELERAEKEKLRGPQVAPSNIVLADDDVAGDFFDAEIGDDFKPVIEAPKDVGINKKGKKKSSAPITMSLKKVKKSDEMPGRKSGFKGVSDAAAGALLDEKF